MTFASVTSRTWLTSPATACPAFLSKSLVLFWQGGRGRDRRGNLGEWHLHFLKRDWVGQVLASSLKNNLHFLERFNNMQRHVFITCLVRHLVIFLYLLICICFLYLSGFFHKILNVIIFFCSFIYLCICLIVHLSTHLRRVIKEGKRSDCLALNFSHFFLLTHAPYIISIPRHHRRASSSPLPSLCGRGCSISLRHLSPLILRSAEPPDIAWEYIT